MNKGYVWGGLGALAIITLSIVGSSEEKPMGDIDVELYQLGESEWGFTLTRRDEFIHAARGLATELAAQEAARKFIVEDLGAKL